MVCSTSIRQEASRPAPPPPGRAAPAALPSLPPHLLSPRCQALSCPPTWCARCQLLSRTTVLFQVLSWKTKNGFCLCLVFCIVSVKASQSRYSAGLHS